MDTSLYGLLMFRDDLDILEEVMNINHRYFKGIAVLDGTDEYRNSLRILQKYPNIIEYVRDRDLPTSYGKPVRDGARQILLESIQRQFGYDGWIFNLHSDEIIFDISPFHLIRYMENQGKEVGVVSNVHFFLHSTMKEGYSYNPQASVISQIQYACFPGFMEHRIFKNRKKIGYDITRHGLTVPMGLGDFVVTEFPLRHYLYRSIEQMKNHITDREKRGWQTYGLQLITSRDSAFVDCLPGYRFSKRIESSQRIKNGITGEIMVSEQPL